MLEREAAMRFRRQRPIAAVVLTAILVIGGAVAGADMVEDYPGAVVNWTKQLAWASGRSPLPLADRGEALARARLDAHKNLLDTLMTVRVDADHRAVDVVSQNKVLRAKMEQIVRQSDVIAENVAKDGLAEVTVQVGLAGPFAQLLLPEGIQHLDSIRTVNPPSRAVDGKQTFNRLIVDARGLAIKPALSLRIHDETGRQVYGPAFISRDFAVQRGVSRYERFHPRVDQPAGAEDKPLVVKALRMQGNGETDVVISKADAARLHSASEHLTFLRQCQVVIVTD